MLFNDQKPWFLLFCQQWTSWPIEWSLFCLMVEVVLCTKCKFKLFYNSVLSNALNQNMSEIVIKHFLILSNSTLVFPTPVSSILSYYLVSFHTTSMSLLLIKCIYWILWLVSKWYQMTFSHLILSGYYTMRFLLFLTPFSIVLSLIYLYFDKISAYTLLSSIQHFQPLKHVMRTFVLWNFSLIFGIIYDYIWLQPSTLPFYRKFM